MLRVAGKLPPCAPRLPRCLCATGMRLWMWKASQGTTTHLHQRCCQGQNSLSHHITTTSTRKKRQVLVVGNSLLRRAEGPICRTDLALREACCLPGAWVKDTTRKLPSLVWPSDYYPLPLFHAGGNQAAMHSPRAIKRDFRASGQSVRESGAQVTFSSLLPFAGSDIRTNRRSQSTNMWFCGWCHCQSFGGFVNGMAYTAPGLLVSNGIHLSQSGKRVFAHKLSRAD